MSQPPPPGQYPGQPYPGQPYMQPPQRKSNTTWIVLGVIFGAMILLCGGCLALTGVFFSEFDKAVQEEIEQDTPSTVVEGESFEHDMFRVAGGWRITESEYGKDFDIKGLRVTSDDARRYAQLTFRIYKGNEVLAEVRCSSNQMQAGETSKMDCHSFDDEVYTDDYDEVRVSDMW